MVFEGICSIILLNPEYVGFMLLRNVSTHVPGYTVSWPRTFIDVEIWNHIKYYYYYYYYFNLRTAAFKAYFAIWIRRSNFRHQASPRLSPRKSTKRRKVELWARNFREFCLNADFHFTFRDPLHATTWDRQLYFPSEGRRAEDFFALKIRRLRPGANPRFWVPKASTLPLDHRSRYMTRKY
jgi:hypothetical protein